MDPKLSTLLKWSTENSGPGAPNGTNGSTAPQEARPFNPDALNALFGGPSDADLLKLSMSAILSSDPEISLDDKLIAFDNFEQLIENLDNANNLEPLALWEPLIRCLGHAEREIRRYAAWCIGTSVQNNEKSQRCALEHGAVQALVAVAVGEDEGREVRRKAVYGLSSLVRNFQGAMDVLVEELRKAGREVGSVEASDMDAVDVLIEGLREEAAAGKA